MSKFSNLYSLFDATTKFGLGYAYPASPGNNGQLSGITDSVDSGRSATYTYDALYRLTAAITTGSANYPKWGLSEAYDRYGNRTAQAVTSGSGPSNSVSVNTSTNRITTSGYAYDAAGNTTNDGFNTLTYDGENRVTNASNSSSSGAYTYDGNGLRVNKVSGSTTTVTIFSGGLDIAEYVNGAAPSSPTNEYIYSSGQKIAAIQSGTTYYLHNDHLSLRVRTDTSGNVVDQRGHYPFGETWYSPSGAPWIFTSYYRDTESGNDYAIARSYLSRLGRFSSPDPIAGSPANPQSLNRYSYALNNPTNLFDPTGMECAYLTDDGLSVESLDFNSDVAECSSNGGVWITGPSQANTTVIVTADAPDFVELPGGNPYGNLIFTNQVLNTPIGNALNRLQKLLNQDPNCLKFLNSKGVDAQQLLATYIQSGLYNSALLPAETDSNGNPTSIVNATSSPNTNSTYLGVGGGITVNPLGAFFQSNFLTLPLTVDNGRITGGTPQAQVFIALHELAHNANDVIEPDAGKPKVGRSNDDALNKNCKNLIKAAQ